MGKKKKLNTTYDFISKIRNFWEINPVTKVVPSQKKYTRRKKHKKRELEE